MNLWKNLIQRGCHTIINDLVNLYGDAAGRLLSQLLYWHTPKTNGETRMWFERDNYKWAAFSAKEWQEQTGLSEWKFRQAVECLISKKVIVKASFHRQRLKCTCLRLNDDQLELDLLKADVQDATGGDINLQTEATSICLSNIDISKESFKKPASKNDAEKYNPKILKENRGNQTLKPNQTYPTPYSASPPPQMGEVKMKASEILAKKKEEIKIHKEPIDIKVNDLGLLWKSRVGEQYGYCEVLKGKEIGNLGHLLRRLRKDLGDELGAELAVKIIEYAIPNWGEFAKRAYKDLGKNGEPPKIPQTWLVQEGSQSAVQLIAEMEVLEQMKLEQMKASYPVTNSTQTKTEKSSTIPTSSEIIPNDLEWLKSM
jgi:hypothetical protein